MSQSRQLAAIMFTDIVGYTAMMQQDEEKAMQVRARHRKVFNALNRKFHGKILQYYGDGTLSIFKSAFEAVECALQMQMAFRENPKIPVRIGIHLGDVILSKEEIAGDGVNIASRIESITVAGSVLISKTVQEEIKNHPSIRTKLLGSFEFKNVKAPMEVYAVSNRGLVVPDPAQLTGKLKVDSLPHQPKYSSYASRRLMISLTALLVMAALSLLVVKIISEQRSARVLEKSIAVLPFENLSQDPGQDYFSDGITEEIIAHLSKVGDLRVVSRTSTRQYKNTNKTIPQIGRELGVSTLLEGSVRKHGDQVRITAQLVDVQSDRHIWAETYDRKIEKIFDIQSEVATEIVRVLQATLTPTEEKYLAKSVTSEITAYNYYLKGKEALQNAGTRKELNQAASFFQKAIEVDSGFAAAYTGLAEAVAGTRFYGVSGKIWRESAWQLNQKALSLDPEMDQGHYLQGVFYLMDNQQDLAQKSFERVLQLNPNHGMARVELGDIMINNNQLENGVEMLIEGLVLELNRKDPRYYLIWGDVYRQLGELEKARMFLNQALKLKPDYVQAYELLLELSMHEKNYREVLQYAEKMVRLEKNIFSLDRLAWANMLLGRYQKAEKIWLELGEMVAKFEDPYYAIPYKHRLGYVMWKNGKQEEAYKLFEEQIQDDQEILDKGIETNISGQAYDLAAVHAFLGHREEALKWTEMATKKGFFSTELVDRDPLFNPIRDDPQFKKIIEDERQEERERHPLFQFARKRIDDLEKKGILSL